MNKVISQNIQAGFINQFLSNKNLQAVVLFFVAIGIYSNTFNHEYVYDDIIVIQSNTIVQKGFAGIPDLLTKDSFYGYNKGNSDLTGGRYRPLSLITFAIDHELFGNNAPFEHIINVLLYALTCVALLFTLYLLFPSLSPLIIFGGALLFVVHPSHTEVVANIKSRDEILCMVFILATFFFWMKLLKEKKTLNLIFALFSFSLALLSKEHAILLLVWLPLAWWLNKEALIKRILISLFPFIIVAGFYLFIRSSFVGIVGDRISTDVMNSPYYLANDSEKFATIIWVFLLYMIKTFYPYSLSYDYTYNAIPYSNFYQPHVWLSLLLFIGMIAWIVISIFKKQYHALLLLIWLLPIILVSNLFFNIGAPFADRFLFLPTIGICIMIIEALFMFYRIQKDETKKKQPIFLIVLVISGFYSFKTFERNFDWKSNKSIFAADAPKVPNSIKATLNYGSILMTEADTSKDENIKKEKLDSAFHLLKKGIAVYGTADLYNHFGAYYNLINQTDSSEYYYRKSLKVKNFAMAKTNLLGVLQKKGAKLHSEKKEDSALIVFRKQLELDATYVDVYNNIGTVYFAERKFDSAEFYFNKTLLIQPTHQSAINNLANTYLNEGNYFFQKNNYDAASEYYIKAIKFKPDHVEAYANAGVIEMQKKNYTEAKKYFETALQYNSNHEFSRTRLIECEKLISK